MSASRCSSATALAVVAVAALAACEERDVETRPFRIAVTVGDRPLGEGIAATTAFVLNGVGDRRSDVALAVPGAVADDGGLVGDVLVAFDPSAAPGLAFPPQLHGAQVRVVVVVDPAHLGPRGEPLPVVGFRVALGAAPDFRQQLLLSEGTYADANGLGVVGPAPFGIAGIDRTRPDVPEFLLEDGASTFEPAECGLVYYDLLDVVDDVEGIRGDVLRTGERLEMSIGEAAAPEEPPWTVLHVLSWHRDGRCTGQAQAWNQFAAWRPPRPSP